MSRVHRSSSPLAFLTLVALGALVAGCGTVPPSGPPITGSPVWVESPSATPSAASTASPTPQPTPESTAAGAVPIVPVTDFRTTATSVDRATVAAILSGTNAQFKQLELVSDDADGILGALSLERPSAADRLVLAPTAGTLAADLGATPSRLGLVRASEVGPSVRALGWGKLSLFGVARVRSVSDWPLQATLKGSAAAGTFDPAQTWTIAAAGDVMLDRGVYDVVKNQGKGVDYPFAGGTATITSHYCCSSMGWTLPRTKRLDTSPAVRNLMSGADLAMVNLEGPAPAKATYHPHGMTFNFDQSFLAGLKYAGIDVVSLANNHIGNAGRQGILDTIAALNKLGIAHSGAGANTAAARTPALFTVDGVKVALLAYDSIASSYGAGPAKPGSAQLSWGTAPDDIRAARSAGAQVVIVYPHWGLEYHTGPTSAERTWAHQMIDAGADLIIGNHAHWAGAMEVYKGKPIWYALGNFVFDQTWSEQTEEGLVLELTFSGSTLVQAWLHPTVILNGAQPNLLDTAGGKIVLDQVYGASKSSW